MPTQLSHQRFTKAMNKVSSWGSYAYDQSGRSLMPLSDEIDNKNKQPEYDCT